MPGMSDMHELKKRVYEANLRLANSGLVIETFGNVSGVDRQAGWVAIKPSGVAYDTLTADHMVVVSLETGEVLDGSHRPSVDTPTHLALYRGLAGIGGVAHTHSLYATAWAQARRDIPVLGTTHADYCHGVFPCARPLTPAEIESDYEANIGKTLVERMEGLDPKAVPGALAANHGPFTWGGSADDAVHQAIILEHLARLASETLRVDSYPRLVSKELLDKHYLRKHGKGTYYGQRPPKP